MLEIPQKTGFLGLKTTPAKVRVSVEEPDAPAAPVVEEKVEPEVKPVVEETPAEEPKAEEPAAARQLIEEELEVREFVPTIEKIVTVSSFSTPSTWQVETDRGPASLVLKAEEDIRRLGGRTHLLIAGGDGVQFRVRDTTVLDRHSRKLLERFL